MSLVEETGAGLDGLGQSLVKRSDSASNSRS